MNQLQKYNELYLMKRKSITGDGSYPNDAAHTIQQEKNTK